MKNQIVDKEERYIANVQPLETPAFGNALLVKTVGDGPNGSLPVELTGPFNTRGHLEVEIASQISPPFVARFYKLYDGWVDLTVESIIGDHIITVADATNAVIGQSVVISDSTNKRFFFGHVIAINGLNVTVDSPIDFTYAVGSQVAFASHDMNVNGSLAAPHIFGLRQAENPADPQLDIEVDITRVLSSMTTTALGDLNDFGDIVGGLTNGMVLRKRYIDGSYGNIFNIKTNLDLALIAYDYDRYVAGNPGQGVNGQKWRMTFGGEEKMGTVIRLSTGEDLEWVIQDDLSSLVAFENVGEGALVAD